MIVVIELKLPELTGIRFAALAAEIRGQGYNSSSIVAIMPIVASFIEHYLKKGLDLYAR
jgi:hypothetical protein